MSISNLVVPILLDRQLWGLLAVQQCRSERVWETDEISLLRHLTAQMAIALNQRELHAQVQQEVRHQQAMNELSQAILRAQTLEDFFALALQKILEMLQVDQVAIGQYHAAKNHWLLIAEARRSDTFPSLLGEELDLAPTELWDNPPTAAPIVINMASPYIPRPAAIARLFAGPWILSPLAINAGFWGGLILYSSNPASYGWGTQKLNLIQAVSQLLSLAVQQNLYFRRWQRQAQQQAGLYRVTNAIRESLELPEIFNRAAQEVKGLLQVERVIILEFNPNQRLWIVQADEQSGEDTKSYVGLEVPDDNNSLTQRLKQGEVVRVNPSEHYPEEMLQVLACTFPGAWLLVPLQVNQMTWGLLHCIQKDDWQDWQQEIAIAVADKLAIAIQQSMLYQQVQSANFQLQELALLDGLTQIPNRRYFDDCLEEEWFRARRDSTCLSLMLCDVDFFKRYNDHLGHQAGDECLITIAHLLQRVVQRSGDLVARYGGEEFGVILPNTTSVGGSRLAEDIQAALKALAIPHPASEVSAGVTLSLGIACLFPQAEATSARLLALADRALYQAKRRGRNQFCMLPAPQEDDTTH